MEKEENQTVGATDSSVQKTSYMKLDMLENICKMLRESRLLYGVDIWRMVGTGESKLSTGHILQENINEFQK